MDEGSWRHESKYVILEATPELRERFREGTREKFKEEHGEGHAPTDEEIERMAALAWHIRAREVCRKADLLVEEGVPNSEIKNILQISPNE